MNRTVIIIAVAVAIIIGVAGVCIYQQSDKDPMAITSIEIDVPDYIVDRGSQTTYVDTVVLFNFKPKDTSIWESLKGGPDAKVYYGDVYLGTVQAGHKRGYESYESGLGFEMIYDLSSIIEWTYGDGTIKVHGIGEKIPRTSVYLVVDPTTFPDNWKNIMSKDCTIKIN